MEIYNLLKALGISQTSEEGRALVKGAVIQAFIQETFTDGQALLRFGPKSITGYLKQPLEAGQTVKLEVLETAPRLLFQAVDPKTPIGGPLSGSSQSTSSLPGSLSAPAPSQPGLLSGAVAEGKQAAIWARVVEKKPDGSIRIQILESPRFPPNQPEDKQPHLLRNMKEGMVFKARIQETGLERPLGPGQEVRFLIKETHPQLVLEPSAPKADPKQPLFQALTQFLSRPEVLPREARDFMTALKPLENLPPEIQTRIDRLAAQIQALSPKPGQPDMDFVPRLMNGLGINHPTSSLQEDTARLWSEIINTPHDRHRVDQESLRLLTESTARIFERVEVLQTLNQETSRFEQTLFFSFPLFWPGESGKGELTFKRPSDKKKSKRDDPYRITLLLNLTRLGRIKADLQILKQRVQGAIWTETRRSRDTVDQALDQFLTKLKTRGIEVEHIQVNIFPSETPPPESLLADLLPQKQSMIDLKV